MLTKSFYEVEREGWSRRAADYDSVFAPISMQVQEEVLIALGNLTGRRHLDVACGTGHLVAEAMTRGAVSTGVDFAQPMIDIARRNYPEARFLTADAVNLPFEDTSFHAATCTFGLSHMTDPRAAIKEVHRVLQPGGTFAFTLWCGPDDGNEAFAIIHSSLKQLTNGISEFPAKRFRLRFADVPACGAMTREAGFEFKIARRISAFCRLDSAGEMVDSLLKMSIRTSLILDSQPPEVQDRVLDRILSETESRRSDSGISLAFPALLIVARKPL